MGCSHSIPAVGSTPRARDLVLAAVGGEGTRLRAAPRDSATSVPSESQRYDGRGSRPILKTKSSSRRGLLGVTREVSSPNAYIRNPNSQARQC